MMFCYLYDKGQLNSNLPNAHRLGTVAQTCPFTFSLIRKRAAATCEASERRLGGLLLLCWDSGLSHPSLWP